MLDSPYRLTALTIAGCLLGTAGLLGSSVHSIYNSLPRLMACVVFVVIGMLGMYWASYTLRECVQNERWPPESITPFRRAVDHPIWKCVMVLLVFAMLLILIQAEHHRGYFWCVFFLLQTQTQIGSAFVRPRRTGDAHAGIDWSKMAPLTSDHWGER